MTTRSPLSTVETFLDRVDELHRRIYLGRHDDLDAFSDELEELKATLPRVQRARQYLDGDERKRVDENTQTIRRRLYERTENVSDEIEEREGNRRKLEQHRQTVAERRRARLQREPEEEEAS